MQEHLHPALSSMLEEDTLRDIGSGQATPDRIAIVLAELSAFFRESPQRRVPPRFEVMRDALARWSARCPDESYSLELIRFLDQTYVESPVDSPLRGAILLMLVQREEPNALRGFAELLVHDPPQHVLAALAPMVPLFHRRSAAPVVFPTLLQGMSNPKLASAILDLANHYTRCGWVESHPAADRVEELMHLLEALVCRLRAFQETSSERPPQGHQQVNESLSLSVSLCDALAWIGDRRARRVLQDMLDLRHRRLRVEAAAALFRLGDGSARETLRELAAEPSVRLRVLAYVEELGLEGLIPDALRSGPALAEAEFTNWLSDPTQLGFPPSSCELLDQRTLGWPGYEEPRDCYLFRFGYGFETEAGLVQASNIGIAGPLNMAFAADLGNRPVADIYAIFAGWHVEHPEIVDTPLTPSHASLIGELDGPLEHMREQGLYDLEPAIHSKFFETLVAVARASQQGVRGLAVSDGTDCLWLATEGIARPLTPELLLFLDRGRRLLKSFNDEWE